MEEENKPGDLFGWRLWLLAIVGTIVFVISFVGILGFMGGGL